MPDIFHSHHGEAKDNNAALPHVVGTPPGTKRGSSSWLMLIPVLMVSIGAGLVTAQSRAFPTLSHLKASLFEESGSGSILGTPCDFQTITQGAALDTCDLILGLSCASDSTCQCARGTWDGARCQLPPPTPSLRVRVPPTFDCGPRCSTQYDFTSVMYESSASDCVAPIPDSVRYFLDCSCESVRHESYADFTARCERKTLPPSPASGDTSACAEPYCPSGNACVCCNGAQTPDCAFICPDKKSKPVTDCEQCGKDCVSSPDRRGCVCGPDKAAAAAEAVKKKCDNGAANPPACTQCPLGLVGSVCASEPNVCDQRSAGEVLPNCRCDAPKPTDATCPAETPSPTPLSFSDRVDFAASLSAALVADPPPPLFPVTIASDVGKAGYVNGKMIFATTLTIINVSPTPLTLSALEINLNKLFGTIPFTISEISGETLQANIAFDGKEEMNILAHLGDDDEERKEEKKDIPTQETKKTTINRLPPGATGTVTFTIAVASNARHVQWEAPVKLSAVSDSGETMQFTPTSITWGLYKRPSQSPHPAQQRSATASPEEDASTQFGLLAGEVFRDENANEKWEPTESGIAKVKIVITDHKGIQQILFTDNDGRYETVAAKGEVSVAISSVNPALGKDHRFTTPFSYVATIVVANDIVRVPPVGVAS